jgi:hypothetical protein
MGGMKGEMRIKNLLISVDGSNVFVKKNIKKFAR